MIQQDFGSTPGWYGPPLEAVGETESMNDHKFNITTITLSIPHETKLFLEQLADDGFNRSSLMLKMIKIIEELYYTYPQIPLPRGHRKTARHGGERDPLATLCRRRTRSTEKKTRPRTLGQT